jgi:hypothetical protein
MSLIFMCETVHVLYRNESCVIFIQMQYIDN